MEKLKNGAYFLCAEILNESDSIVLAVSENDFVTWMMNPQGDTFWGHYHGMKLDGLKKAIRDFDRRCGR